MRAFLSLPLFRLLFCSLGLGVARSSFRLENVLNLPNHFPLSLRCLVMHNRSAVSLPARPGCLLRGQSSGRPSCTLCSAPPRPPFEMIMLSCAFSFSLSLCVSVSLSFCLCMCVCVCVSVCLSVYLSCVCVCVLYPITQVFMHNTHMHREAGRRRCKFPARTSPLRCRAE